MPAGLYVFSTTDFSVTCRLSCCRGNQMNIMFLLVTLGSWSMHCPWMVCSGPLMPSRGTGQQGYDVHRVLARWLPITQLSASLWLRLLQQGATLSALRSKQWKVQSCKRPYLTCAVAVFCFLNSITSSDWGEVHKTHPMRTVTTNLWPT